MSRIFADLLTATEPRDALPRDNTIPSVVETVFDVPSVGGDGQEAYDPTDAELLDKLRLVLDRATELEVPLPEEVIPERSCPLFRCSPKFLYTSIRWRIIHGFGRAETFPCVVVGKVSPRFGLESRGFCSMTCTFRVSRTDVRYDFLGMILAQQTAKMRKSLRSHVASVIPATQRMIPVMENRVGLYVDDSCPLILPFDWQPIAVREGNAVFSGFLKWMDEGASCFDRDSLTVYVSYSRWQEYERIKRWAPQTDEERMIACKVILDKSNERMRESIEARTRAHLVHPNDYPMLWLPTPDSSGVGTEWVHGNTLPRHAIDRLREHRENVFWVRMTKEFCDDHCHHD